jgi:acetyl/propionyl-CoA carboxylase alpha subunit
MHIPGGPGVRVDKAVYTSYVIPPYYDSMIAKLICKGRTRQQALIRMKNALSEFIIDGLPTTIPFHQEVMEHPDFVSGNYNLDFVEKMMTTKEKNPPTKLTLQRSSETDQTKSEEKITDKDVELVAEVVTTIGEDNN